MCANKSNRPYVAEIQTANRQVIIPGRQVRYSTRQHRGSVVMYGRHANALRELCKVRGWTYSPTELASIDDALACEQEAKAERDNERYMYGPW